MVNTVQNKTGMCSGMIELRLFSAVIAFAGCSLGAVNGVGVVTFGGRGVGARCRGWLRRMVLRSVLTLVRSACGEGLRRAEFQ